MFQEPTKPAKPLSVVQAEQRTLSQLKNLGVPWVFIQPTRIKKVKVPKQKRRYRNQETFEKLGADDLAFLGNANVDLSEDDIKTLLQSVQNDDIDFNSPEISKTPSPRKSALTPPEKETKIPSPINSNRYQTKIISLTDDEMDDDEELFSARGESFDTASNLFGEDPDLSIPQTNTSRQKSIINNETQTMKNLIMQNLTKKREEEVRNKDETKIKPFVLITPDDKGSIYVNHNSESKSPDSQRDDEFENAYDIPSGRKKLLNLMDNISSVGKEPSLLQQAEMRLKPQFDETREKLQYSVGAARFRQFCEETYGKAPDILADLDLSKAKAKSSLSRPRIGKERPKLDTGKRINK